MTVGLRRFKKTLKRKSTNFFKLHNKINKNKPKPLNMKLAIRQRKEDKTYHFKLLTSIGPGSLDNYSLQELVNIYNKISNPKIEYKDYLNKSQLKKLILDKACPFEERDDNGMFADHFMEVLSQMEFIKDIPNKIDFFHNDVERINFPLGVVEFFENLAYRENPGKILSVEENFS